MNRTLVTASLIAALTAGIHILAGGADVVKPLLDSAMTAEPRLTLYAVWHMVSIVLVLSAVALFVGSLPRHAQAARYLVLFISALWCSFGVIFLLIGFVQVDSGWVFKLPQWVLLLPVGILAYWGSSNQPFNAIAPKDGAPH